MLLRTTIRDLDRLTTQLGRAPEIARHLAFGARDEDEAHFYLRKLGFTIIAREYLRQYAHAQSKEPPHRFDVIGVYIESNDDSSDSTDITVFRNAFTMS